MCVCVLRAQIYSWWCGARNVWPNMWKMPVGRRHGCVFCVVHFFDRSVDRLPAIVLIFFSLSLNLKFAFYFLLSFFMFTAARNPLKWQILSAEASPECLPFSGAVICWRHVLKLLYHGYTQIQVLSPAS